MLQKDLRCRKTTLTLFRPGEGEGGLLRPAPTLKMYNFMTIKAITTKLGDFS